jgi:glycosyltransferase involved in cell wall biosynthesis
VKDDVVLESVSLSDSLQAESVGAPSRAQLVGMQAADLYITPYLDEAQITSGTLAYAFGAGKAVISEPHWHAAELLRDQRGVLAPFADPRAIAHEVSGLLRDETRRNAMSGNAYKLGRKMGWSNTAGLYMRFSERLGSLKEDGSMRIHAADAVYPQGALAVRRHHEGSHPILARSRRLRRR